MLELKNFCKLECSISGSENVKILWLNAIRIAHVVQRKVNYQILYSTCVLYFFSIVFKTRKSIEEYKTGHKGSCESQTEAYSTGSIAVCFSVTGYFETRMGKLE